ncbi:MAG: hypothetical protein RRB13_10545 [bacterium]|nr:hypothetical protein [bacterium]
MKIKFDLFYWILDAPQNSFWARPLRILLLVLCYFSAANSDPMIGSIQSFTRQLGLQLKDVFLFLVSAPFVGIVWYWRDVDRKREIIHKEKEHNYKSLHDQRIAREMAQVELVRLVGMLDSDENFSAYVFLERYFKGSYGDELKMEALKLISDRFDRLTRKISEEIQPNATLFQERLNELATRHSGENYSIEKSTSIQEVVTIALRNMPTWAQEFRSSNWLSLVLDRFPLLAFCSVHQSISIAVLEQIGLFQYCAFSSITLETEKSGSMFLGCTFKKVHIKVRTEIDLHFMSCVLDECIISGPDDELYQLRAHIHISHSTLVSTQIQVRSELIEIIPEISSCSD